MHVTSKIIFVITYLLEDEQELSLGMLIRPKRIYNFWCSMLVLHQFYHCFIYVLVCFYKFSGTNILTRCRSASSCFLLFLVSEILHRKYSRKRTGQKPEVLYLLWQHRSPKESRRQAAGRPHPSQARPRAGPRLGMVWAPWVPPGLASPPIYSPPRKKPQTPEHNSTKITDAAAIVNPRLGGFWSRSRHSARGENHPGGILHHHDAFQGDVWVVHLRTMGP